MNAPEQVNILLVDDQPAKLLSYEVILRELGENLLKANSAQEAFEHLLKTDIAVVLVDVCMPDLDGYELARMIRDHPRFQQTAIIFISAILLTDLDFLRGYEAGAVDYVPVPVVPEILRAKVKIFAELYRKSQQLARLNRELEARVAERTAALEQSTGELRRSEERLRLALDAAQMGWWDYDIAGDRITWSQSLVRMMGFEPATFGGSLSGVLPHIHPDDRGQFLSFVQNAASGSPQRSCEVRFLRPDGSMRWAFAAGQVVRDASDRPIAFAGVDMDITERKQTEERQQVLVRELDHRAKNMLAVMQSVLHLSRADTVTDFVGAVEGRIRALSRAHSLLSESRWRGVELGRIVDEEIAPFSSDRQTRVVATGPAVLLPPATAQSLSLAVHELVTNAVKYGALSQPQGCVTLSWSIAAGRLVVSWIEMGGPAVRPPRRQGFGTKVIAASIERQLGGSASFDWRPMGLSCVLVVPLDAEDGVQQAQPGTHRVDQPAASPAPIRLDGTRILLVEDEMLIAVMTKEALTDLGFTVVGPIGTVAEALATAGTVLLDGAILDVNLAGERVYPVADLLAARGIPFVFVTGYGAEGVDRGYAHVQTLEKPIDTETLRQLFVDPASTAPILASERQRRAVAP